MAAPAIEPHGVPLAGGGLEGISRRGQGFELGNFAGLHAQGQLASPEDAAQRVLAYLERADFGSQAVADVRG